MIKRLTALAVFLVLSVCTFAGCGGGTLTMLDRGGTEFAKIGSRSGLADAVEPCCYDFAQTVRDEATEALRETLGCDRKTAEKKLLRGNYRVFTTLEPEYCRILEKAAKDGITATTEFGGAIVTPDGAVSALYGRSQTGENNATAKKPPYSSFKPLSVYAPAMEQGKIHWATTVEDAPLKKVSDSGGNLADWPVNASGIYSRKKVTVCEGIRQSLNTVAVRCLTELGVDQSIGFLTRSFGIDLNAEQTKANLYGNEEILGNIAMGYLSGGVSVLDMAGFYRIFIRDGKYVKPFTVTKICDGGGKTVYEHQAEEKEVISPITAYLMNRLLQQVVSPDGTGKDAAIPGADIGGKTGTGSTDDGNWFVGFSDECTCAVWHGAGEEKNLSPGLFAEILNGCGLAGNGKYRNVAGVKKAAFCRESGGLLTANCRIADTGYFSSDTLPELCKIHSQK